MTSLLTSLCDSQPAGGPNDCLELIRLYEMCVFYFPHPEETVVGPSCCTSAPFRFFFYDNCVLTKLQHYTYTHYTSRLVCSHLPSWITNQILTFCDAFRYLQRLSCLADLFVGLWHDDRSRKCQKMPNYRPIRHIGDMIGAKLSSYSFIGVLRVVFLRDS